MDAARTPAPARPALVCRGADCRGGAQERLCDALRAAGIDVLTVGCLGVCDGPVAMLPVRGRWEIVARIRGKEARQRLVDALTRQRRKSLSKRAVGGARRRKAIAKGTGKLKRRRPALRASLV